MPSSVQLGDANTPITQITDNAVVAGAGVATSAQLVAADTPCTLVEITTLETNAQPMVFGSSAVQLGASPAFAARIGAGVLYPGQTKVYAVPNANQLYQSGLATDGFTWTILK